jgi:hypothetical protein
MPLFSADSCRTTIVGDSKYRYARYLDTTPHTHIHSSAVSIVALTWSTPQRDRYGLVTDAEKTSAFSCQYIAFVSPSINADSDVDVRSDGMLLSCNNDLPREDLFDDAAVTAASESIVRMAVVAATLYFFWPSFFVVPLVVSDESDDDDDDDDDDDGGGGDGCEDPALITVRALSVAVLEDEAAVGLVVFSTFFVVLFGVSRDDDDDGVGTLLEAAAPGGRPPPRAPTATAKQANGHRRRKTLLRRRRGCFDLPSIIISLVWTR